MTSYDVVIGLGSNLGDREATLRAAVDAIGAHGAVVAVSRIYSTAPVGPPQPEFLNAALRLSTELEPRALLGELLEIERRAGRERRERWGPRTLDLDILWIPGVVIETPELAVPHPQLSVRPFALVPLLDVAPEATDPTSGVAYATILAGLADATPRPFEPQLVRGSDPSGNPG